MKKIVLLLNLSLLFIFTSCQEPPQGQVTILHSNDMHTQYIPLTATWVDSTPQPLVGGIVALEYHIRQQKKLWPHALVMDAGDFLTGTPLAKIEVDGAKGGAFVNMMNMVGYDVMTIGNHEFDNGQENLYKLLNMLNCDIISANLLINEKPVADAPYTIYTVDGIRVGVIGIMLKGLFEVAAKKNLENVTVLDPVATAQKYIDEIDRKTDLIVLLTHNGIEEDEYLAENVHNADLIIGGHSHTRLPEPRLVNGVLICQAGSKTRNLGRISVDVAGDSISGYSYELINTWVESIDVPNARLARMVAEFKRDIDKEFNKKLGTTKSALIGNHDSESNVGNFITDAMRNQTGVDFGLMNSGGIRKDIPAGPITKLDIAELLPFSNTVETFECTGEQVLQFVRKNAGETEGYSGSMQISGLTYRYRYNSDKKLELLETKINGKPIDPEKTYKGASVDFILQGQTEKYLGFKPATTNTTGIILSDMVIDYLKENPIIEPRLENRMKRVF